MLVLTRHSATEIRFFAEKCKQINRSEIVTHGDTYQCHLSEMIIAKSSKCQIDQTLTTYKLTMTNYFHHIIAQHYHEYYYWLAYT